jgi:hypothetical protein
VKMPSKWINLTDDERKQIKEKIPSLAKKMEHKKISVSSAKAKGRNLQHWVCERISKILNLPYAQADDQCLIHSREMGISGLDIVLRGEAFKAFPFSIECKSSEQLNLVDTIEQASANCIKNTDWLIVHRRKAIPNPIVIMSWETFERIWSK